MNFFAESFCNIVDWVAHTHESMLNWSVNNSAKQYFLYIIHRNNAMQQTFNLTSHVERNMNNIYIQLICI